MPPQMSAAAWTVLRLVARASGGVTVNDLASIFNRVGVIVIADPSSSSPPVGLDTKDLLYTDFCQAIGAIACFYPPTRNAFTPLEDKLGAFISKHLKPNHQRR